MTVEEKLESVRTLVAGHNAVIGGPGQLGYVDVDQFLSKIRVLGGTDERRLKRMSYEDILKCLPEFEGIQPVALAKDIAAVFREQESDSRPISGRRASLMTHEELVKAFDPEEPDSPVGKRLKSLSRNEPFVVFLSGRAVDVPTTLKLLEEVKQNYSGRKQVQVGGEVKPVYRIGELPDAYAEENPLYPGRPLRPDGTCDQTGRSWEGIPTEVRQLVRVAIDTGELKVNIENAHQTIDIALRSDAATALRQRYQQAAVRFGELQQIGDLPKLRIPLNTRSGGGSLQTGKKVIFG